MSNPMGGVPIEESGKEPKWYELGYITGCSTNFQFSEKPEIYKFIDQLYETLDKLELESISPETIMNALVLSDQKYAWAVKREQSRRSAGRSVNTDYMPLYLSRRNAFMCDAEDMIDLATSSGRIPQKYVESRYSLPFQSFVHITLLYQNGYIDLFQYEYLRDSLSNVQTDETNRFVDMDMEGPVFSMSFEKDENKDIEEQIFVRLYSFFSAAPLWLWMDKISKNFPGSVWEEFTTIRDTDYSLSPNEYYTELASTLFTILSNKMKNGSMKLLKLPVIDQHSGDISERDVVVLLPDYLFDEDFGSYSTDQSLREDQSFTVDLDAGNHVSQDHPGSYNSTDLPSFSLPTEVSANGIRQPVTTTGIVEEGILLNR
jgi:hypothetical protein